MLKFKSLLAFAAVFGLAMTSAMCAPVHAASDYDRDAENGITVTVTETETGTIIEGMIPASATGPTSRLLANGVHTQYPSDGGTWQYGFWNVKIRSYYTVNKVHGSSVKLNGDLSRSVDTAKNKKSIAEKYAVNIPGNNDAYYYRIC